MNNMSVSYVQLFVALIIFLGIAIYGNGKRAPDDSIPPAVTDKGVSEVKSSEENTSQRESGKRAPEHHPLVKPGAAVSLKSTEPLYAAAPGVYEYQLAIVSPSHSGRMVVDVSAGDGVNVISPDHQVEFELDATGEYKVPVTLGVNTEGRFYIQLHVSITADGQSSTRVIAAILQVGEPAVKAQKAAPQSAVKDSDAVISLPAQETISPR